MARITTVSTTYTDGPIRRRAAPLLEPSSVVSPTRYLASAYGKVAGLDEIIKPSKNINEAHSDVNACDADLYL